MYFSGAQSINIEQTVLESLKTWLEARFAEEPHLTAFTKWAEPGAGKIGLKISYKDREAASEYSSKRPMLWLSIPEGSHAREVWRTYARGPFERGTEHTIEIVIELFVSAPALEALQPLRDALANIFDINQYQLRTIGLEEAEFEPDKKRQESGNYVEPHRLTIVCRSLPN